MQYGVVFPQTEIGADPVGVKDYAQAAEGLGFKHLLAFDHVLGANVANRENWPGPYTHEDLFHEPLVLFGYLAAITQQIEFVTGILILPQRQTVLVAKQVAEVDVLSNGRMRLGIGVGWNPVEFDALNENFKDRGRRSEEQVDVLRELWTDELVTYKGKWHNIDDAGLKPMPVQRPIPVWFGGHAEQTLNRVASMGDGWFPLFRPDDQAKATLEKLQVLIADAGRKSEDVGIESWISVGNRSPEEWAADAQAWKELGATHISVNTMRAGFTTLDEHITAIRKFKEVTEGI